VEWLVDVDECPIIQQTVLNHLKSLQKTNEEIEAMPENQRQRLLDRLTLLNTNINNRCPESGFIMIAPKKDGRIECTGKPLVHQD